MDRKKLKIFFFFSLYDAGTDKKNVFCFVQGIHGVSKIKDGYNPATWMLEVTTMAQEEILGVNFTEIYKNSDLFR